MGRIFRVFLTILPVALSLFFTACSSGKRVHSSPVFDPHKEQIVVLQKQLLEQQNMLDETRRNADEEAAALNPLGARVNAVEAQRTALRSVQSPAPAPEENATVAPMKRAEQTVKKQASKHEKTS